MKNAQFVRSACTRCRHLNIILHPKGTWKRTCTLDRDVEKGCEGEGGYMEIYVPMEKGAEVEPPWLNAIGAYWGEGKEEEEKALEEYLREKGKDRSPKRTDAYPSGEREGR